MKDFTNKGKDRGESALTAELSAVRDLVSREFDNRNLMSETYRCSRDPASATGEEAMGYFTSDISEVHLPKPQVEVLAARALETLASGVDRTGNGTPMAHLFSLTEAYLDDDDRRRHDTLGRIMAQGLKGEDIVDNIIPDTARYMGELWAHDKLSFADVTIGTARLQETVRAIGQRNTGIDGRRDKPAVLLVVPGSEQHTLGVFVAAEQFRRLGVFAHLVLGDNPAEIIRAVRKQQFAMVGISASTKRSLTRARELIKALKDGIPRFTPVVIGGPVTSMDLNLRAMTGADHVTSDASEALRLCGVETQSMCNL